MTTRTANEVRKMLREVVEEGTGTAAQVPGYHIAGKTGTAAKPDETRRLFDVALRRVVRRVRARAATRGS